jgi:acyl dehydratase
MAADGLSIEELKSKIGVEWPPLVYEIEKGTIRRFAQAVGDSSPLWQDDEYGTKSGFGGIIAPPTFVLTLGFDQIIHPLTQIPSQTVLHGSTELDYYQPVSPGDVITATTVIAGVRQREGKIGKTTFVTFDITYKNQEHVVVARCRQRAIIY